MGRFSLKPQFDGETYDPRYDEDRLRTQLGRVWDYMSDGQWHTIRCIREYAGGTEAAVSARIRDLRKTKFGGYTVEHRRHPDFPPSSGLWQYRLEAVNHD